MTSLEIRLGDIVRVPTADGDQLARVVMLGETRKRLKIDHDFIEWVLRANILATTSIFVEWIGANPYTHSDPSFAPVGGYMSTTVGEHVHFVCRAAA